MPDATAASTEILAPPEPPPQSTEPVVGRKRLVDLDALRGVAAFWVVIYHYTFAYGNIEPIHPAIRVRGGPEAVDLFFMISGYVIAMSLQRSSSAGRFLLARANRLYPAFWFSMLLTFVILRLHPLPGYEQRTIADLLANITMLPETLFGRTRIDTAYWTLEIEVLFYLLMAVLFIAGLKERLVECTIALVALSMLYGLGQHTHHTLLPDFVAVALNLPNISRFAVGLCVYDLQRYGFRPKHAILLAMIPPAVFLNGNVANVVYIVTLGAIFAAAATGRFAIFKLRPILFLGGISYPLYLVNQLIGFVVLNMLLRGGLNINLAILPATIAIVLLATAISFGIERPAMRLLRRPDRPRSHEAATPASAKAV